MDVVGYSQMLWHVQGRLKGVSCCNFGLKYTKDCIIHVKIMNHVINILSIKQIRHPKINKFTHPHAVPDVYDFSPSDEHEDF